LECGWKEFFFTPFTVDGNSQHIPIFSKSLLKLHAGQSLGSGKMGWGIVGVLMWECLTACKAFSLANAKGKGTNDWVIRSLDD
jgi:hypothetical protein